MSTAIMSVVPVGICKAIAIISSVIASANSKTPAVALALSGSPIAIAAAFVTLAKALPCVTTTTACPAAFVANVESSPEGAPVVE